MAACVKTDFASDDENDFDEYEHLLMSNLLCQFFNVPLGSRASFVRVKEKVQKYIRENRLIIPQDGRKFCLDQNLRNMLQLTTEDTDMNYFRLQCYLFKQLKR